MSPDVGRVDVLENSRERSAGAERLRAALVWQRWNICCVLTGDREAVMANTAGFLQMRWQTKLTSLLQLQVAAIAHFAHAVLHVFQRVSVPGAAPANNLPQTTYHLSTNE